MSDMFPSPFLLADLDDSWLSSMVAELLPEDCLITNVGSGHSTARMPQVPSQAPCLAASFAFMSTAYQRQSLIVTLLRWLAQRKEPSVTSRG
jgi:hypothetical protein